MDKEGYRVKDNKTGEIYIIIKVAENAVVLKSETSLKEKLISKRDLKESYEVLNWLH